MEQDPFAPPPRRTGTVGSKLAGALIGAAAALSIGGVGFAFAQEAGTPTPEAPAAQTPAAPADEDCPDKRDPGRAGGGGGHRSDAVDTDGAEV